MLKNDKYGVCQNIKRFITGAVPFNSSDVSKCESCVNTVNITLNSAGDLKSLIDSKRSNLFLEDHTLKPFASNELQYLEEASKQVIALHEEFQSVSNKLRTTQISLARRFPFVSCLPKSAKSRRKNENNRKIKKTKEKRLQQRARTLLGNLSSVEIADQVFEKNRFSEKLVVKINAGFTAKFSKRLHLDLLCWLLEKNVFCDTVKENLKEVAALLESRGNERKQREDSESDEDEEEIADSAETGNEADHEGVEAVESGE